MKLKDLPLSFSILEFYCWPVHWDQYLQAMLEQRLKEYKEKKKSGS